MYSYKYALVVYNNKWFSTHVLSVSLSSLNSLSQFLSSIYFHTHVKDVRHLEFEPLKFKNYVKDTSVNLVSVNGALPVKTVKIRLPLPIYKC